MGTILLLALTVTLFSSIFLFVDSFPQPPPQPASQFSAQLLYKTVLVSGVNETKIVGITILHLSGPTLAGTSISIYLYSSDHPSSFTAPYTLASGLNGSAAWNLGQSWSENISSHGLYVPDNITVSIISTTELLFRVTLPGATPILPPQFVAEGTSPAAPTVSQAFTLYVEISDPNLNPNSVYANVSAVPGSGLGTTDKMTYSASAGQFQLSFPSGANTVGTYYVFVNASDASPNGAARNTVAVPIVISAASSSGEANGVQIAVSPLPVVNGTAETIYATVMNTGSSTATVKVTYYVGSTSLGSTSGSITGGGVTTLSHTWTPTAVGTAVLKTVANVSGQGSSTGIYNVTIFPTILFIAHSTPSGRPANNTSAYMAEELKADGFPFTEMYLPCTSALPAAATLGAYDLVIIDFGSASGGSCDASPSSTSQGYVTSAMASPYYTDVLLVGADAWKSTTCSSYSSTLFSDLGATDSGATCTGTVTSATSAATYTAFSSAGLLADGVGALTVNKTLAASSAFTPIATFTNGGTDNYLTVGGATVGTIAHVSGRGRGAVLGTDPALLVTSLAAPASSTWQINAGGAQLLYNVVNYLAGFSTSSGPGRAFSDFAVAGAQVYGTSASHVSTVYVSLRANGAVGGLVSVSLTVNGTIALYGGAPVTATAYVSPNGQNVTVELVWEAQTPGPYTLGVVATGLTGNLYASQSQLPLSILNQPNVFTT